MGKLKDFYRQSSWYSVFNFQDERGSARSYMLFASISVGVVNGLTTGTFYAGYLSSFGIDIVNISILTLMPYLMTSLLSPLVPVILGRFKRRRLFLTVTRIAYFAINILGITVLPLVIKDPQGRMMGLIGIVAVANIVNPLFGSGYSAWHMGYIDPEIRSGYMTASHLVSAAISGILMVALGAVTDGLEGQRRQVLLACFRCAAFLIAMLDVYFLQKPKEPEYKASIQPRVSLVSALKIPLSNKRFMLIMMVYLFHACFGCLLNSVVHTWLLEDVRVTYTYINFINMTNVFFILPTSAFWGRCVCKRGTLGTLALVEMLSAFAYFLHAFMTESNYIWVMTAVKLIQNCVALGANISAGSLIYIALPEEDQTSYLAFYQSLSNVASLLGMSIGTWVVAAMGDRAITIAGFRFTSVPTLFLIQTVIFLVLPFFARWVGKKVEPDGWKFNKRHYHIPFLHKNLHNR